MAQISLLKAAINLCREPRVRITPFIWGHRGLGKSAVIKQICEALEIGFIDMRCSQLESSDIRGFPDKRGDGRTVFLPPADLPITHGEPTEKLVSGMLEALGVGVDPNDPQASPYEQILKFARARVDGNGVEIDEQKINAFWATHNAAQGRFTKGILFLDELNRAQDDVLQAVFQLVLDRMIGQYVLPEGWSIVAAGNYMEGYMTNGFTDEAFLDRFCHMIFDHGESTAEEWADYMGSQYEGAASNVVQFCMANLVHLDGELEGELGFNIKPSRRSWDSVTRVDMAAREQGYPQDVRTEVIAGLVGRDLAIAFEQYDCPIKPQDIVRDGVAKWREPLKQLSRQQQYGLMWGLLSFIKPKIDDDHTAEIALDYATHMCQHAADKDLVVAFCRQLVAGGDEDQLLSEEAQRARAAVISNPQLAKLMGKFKPKGLKQKRFVDRLNERDVLQKALAGVAWGKD